MYSTCIDWFVMGDLDKILYATKALRFGQVIILYCVSLTMHHFRDLNDRPAVDPTVTAAVFFAAVGAAAFFAPVAAAAMPATLLTMPFFAAAAVLGAGFFLITVVPLLVFDVALELLTARPRVVLAGTGGGAMAPGPAPRFPRREEVVDADDAVEAAVPGLLVFPPRVLFDSTRPARAAVATETDEPGFSGETGRASCDLYGEDRPVVEED